MDLALETLSLRNRILHVLVLSGYAFAQPIYDILGRSPEFFLAHSSTWLDLSGLVCLLSFLLPLPVVLLELLTRECRYSNKIHFGIISGLLSVVALLVVKNLNGVSEFLEVTLAVVIGVLVTFLYSKFNPLRMTLTALSPAFLFFPLYFLLGTRVTEVLPTYFDRDVQRHTVKVDAPIIVVVFDELPLLSLLDAKYEIDRHRYPNFYRLRHVSNWYPEARTVSGVTTDALVAILTGREADQRKLPVLKDYPDNLFTLFSNSHHLTAHESVTRLCPAEICQEVETPSTPLERLRTLVEDAGVVYLHLLLPEKWTEFLPPVTRNWVGFRKGGESPFSRGIRTRIFLNYVNQSVSSDQPSLSFLHILFPHLPWVHLPSGKRYTRDTGEVPGLNLLSNRWTEDEALVRVGYQRHLLQLEFVDRLLGMLLDGIEQAGLFDRALIVVTADHGASFGPGQLYRTTDHPLPDEILSIPLFIKAPGQNRGFVDARRILITDILPLMCDALGITRPRPMGGLREEQTSVSWPVVPWWGDHLLERKIRLQEPSAKGSENGDFESLVGQRLEDLQVISSGALSLVLRDVSLYDDVDLSADFLPALVRGRIVSEREELANFLDLAVSVNGTIESIVRTSRTRTSVFEFSALVDESAFKDGRNGVEVFVLRREQRKVLLLQPRRELARGP